jgi:hypothetical protein
MSEEVNYVDVFKEYINKAPKIVVTNLDTSYTVAHRHVARILFCLDLSQNHIINSKVLYHIYLYELSLVLWKSDYRSKPENIYRLMCIDQLIEPLTSDDLGIFRTFDYLLIDDYSVVEFFFNKSYDIIGTSVISTNEFEKFILKYI